MPCRPPRSSAELEGRGREVSRASVYRVMEELESIGLLQRVAVGQGLVRVTSPRARRAPTTITSSASAAGASSRSRDEALELGDRTSLSQRLPLDVSEHEIVIRGACQRCDAAEAEWPSAARAAGVTRRRPRRRADRRRFDCGRPRGADEAGARCVSGGADRPAPWCSAAVSARPSATATKSVGSRRRQRSPGAALFGGHVLRRRRVRPARVIELARPAIGHGSNVGAR